MEEGECAKAMRRSIAWPKYNKLELSEIRVDWRGNFLGS